MEGALCRATSSLSALFPVLESILSQTEHWRQLVSVRLKARANEPCQGRFSTARTMWDLLCLSVSSQCQKSHDKDPTGSVKNHSGENLSSHHHPVWVVLLRGGSLSSLAPDKSWLPFVSSITDCSIACPLQKVCFRVYFSPNLCIFML